MSREKSRENESAGNRGQIYIASFSRKILPFFKYKNKNDRQKFRSKLLAFTKFKADPKEQNKKSSNMM